MKDNPIQLEIVLLVDTSFSYRELCSKEITETKQPSADKAKWATACWNILLQKILPEIFTPGNYVLHLWNIAEGASFLSLELGTCRGENDRWLSIQPDFIRSLISSN